MQNSSSVKKITSASICEYVFKKYLDLKYPKGKNAKRNADRGTETSQKYYSGGELIDTLGWNQETGANTYSYTCEGGSLFAFRTAKTWFVYVNFEDKHVLTCENLADLPFFN